MKGPRKAWIRPVCRDNGALVALALCTTNQRIMVDQEILEWFPPDATGVEITQQAAGMGYEAEWGSVLT